MTLIRRTFRSALAATVTAAPLGAGHRTGAGPHVGPLAARSAPRWPAPTGRVRRRPRGRQRGTRRGRSLAVPPLSTLARRAAHVPDVVVGGAARETVGRRHARAAAPFLSVLSAKSALSALATAWGDRRALK